MAGSFGNDLEYCVWLQASITDGGHHIAKSIWLEEDEDIDCIRNISSQTQQQVAVEYGLFRTIALVLERNVSVMSTCN